MIRFGAVLMFLAVPSYADAPSDASAPTLRPVELAGLFNRKSKIKGPSVCGQRDIIGVTVAPIKNGQCGIANPVRVTSVAGVKLNAPAVIDCNTAKALSQWVSKSAALALKRKGGGLTSLKVVASYACRTRNSQKGAKVSEHAYGRAVDIAGFTLKNGQTLTVLKQWNGKNAKAFRAMHAGACGTFGTVLGPNANKFHRDHFHLDTARYRSGSYCR